MQSDAQERPGDHNVVFGSVFAKIFQHAEPSGYLLYLVEDYKRFAFFGSYACKYLYCKQYPFYVVVCFKECLQPVVQIEIEIDEVFVFVFAKFFHKPSFAYLTRSA